MILDSSCVCLPAVFFIWRYVRVSKWVIIIFCRCVCFLLFLLQQKQQELTAKKLHTAQSQSTNNNTNNNNSSSNIAKNQHNISSAAASASADHSFYLFRFFCGHILLVLPQLEVLYATTTVFIRVRECELPAETLAESAN